MSFEAAVHAKAIHLCHLSLDMCASAGAGHPTSAMSLSHLVTVLMYHTMRWVPDQSDYPTSDRLVLSEGHAVPVIYAAMADIGAAFGKKDERRPLTLDDLHTLREVDSALDGHPNPVAGFPFFDAATGSLGQGLSVAAGLGVAANRDEVDKRIYCIIGDGESREGQIAEAMDFIVENQLTNVLPIFNCNAYGQSDKVSSQQSADRLAAKLTAYGFDAKVIDGHDPAEIREALDGYQEYVNSGGEMPVAIVAKTTKGWGSQTMQGGGWHGKPAAGDKLELAHEELNTLSATLTSALASSDEWRIYPPAEHAAKPAKASVPEGFNQAMARYDMESVIHAGKFAPRKAYGIALRTLGHANPRVYALDADVKNSTFAEWFANDSALSSRFVECRIAEQNMFSVAAGLSAAGKIPFCSTFAKFVARGYDQIELAMISGANVKVVGTHTGLTPASDGPSQMALSDVGWFRSLSTATDHRGNPACYILQPSDAYAAYALTLAMAEHEGMCYMRAARPDVEFIYDQNVEFKLGGFEHLTEGRDVLIITAGFMVHECNKVLDQLDRQGIDAGLVDLYSIPFDADELLDIANQAGGNILTVEDNYGGAIGAAVSDALTASGDAFTIEQMYVRTIPKSARTVDDVLQAVGLDHKSIASRASAMLGLATV